MSIKFECKYKTDSDIEKWTGFVHSFTDHGSHYEIKIVSRSGITVIFGKTLYGGFAFMPDFESGCQLSNFKDRFWNTEKLTALLGEIDGITVAEALYTLADKGAI